MRYTDIKAYKEHTDTNNARCDEYEQKVDKIVSSVKDDDKFAEEIDKLDEEYSDVAKGWSKFDDECIVTNEFFDYYPASLERKILIHYLSMFYGISIDENTTFESIIYSAGYFYYLVKENGKEDYKPLGDEEFECKLEHTILHTKPSCYIVSYNDGWDNEWHNLETFTTEEKAKEFVAEKEQWKSDFKEEFGVDYDTLGDSDFTWDMEDWIAEFVNTNENREEIRYKIEKV